MATGVKGSEGKRFPGCELCKRAFPFTGSPAALHSLKARDGPMGKKKYPPLGLRLSQEPRKISSVSHNQGRRRVKSEASFAQGHTLENGRS